MEREIKMYNGMVYGVPVNRYGLEHGYLDYGTLSKIVGCHILNNQIRMTTRHTDVDYWELILGNDNYDDIYQEFVITEGGYEFLEKYTDEIVYYNEELDVYLWCVTHFGTIWDYVLTNIKLVTE